MSLNALPWAMKLAACHHPNAIRSIIQRRISAVMFDQPFYDRSGEETVFARHLPPVPAITRTRDD
jgi:hypothetical protein